MNPSDITDTNLISMPMPLIYVVYIAISNKKCKAIRARLLDKIYFINTRQE